VHQPYVVTAGPVLGNAALAHAKDVDLLDGEAAAGRCAAKELALVRASRGAAQRDAVAVTEGVLDLVAEVGEGAMQPAHGVTTVERRSAVLELPQRLATPSDAERRRLASRVKLLSWVSLGWMTVEGAVAIIAAAVASSVALLGFGIDSAIGGLASVIVIWRFTGARTFSGPAETRAQKLVAVQFFLLAPYISVESARAAWR
jgi:hypothetical protein